jgi:hypothetical protein
MPDRSLLAAMGKYNETLVKAGVLLAAEGFHPSARGARPGLRATSLSLPDICPGENDSRKKMPSLQVLESIRSIRSIIRTLYARSQRIDRVPRVRRHLPEA